MDSIRKNKLQFVKDNLDNVTDRYIDNIYNSVNEIIPNKKNIIKRIDKMKYIEANIGYVEDDILGKINNQINKSLGIVENKEDRKKRVVLEILNKILVAIDKDEIKSIDEFVDIRRDDLLNDDVKELIEENKTYLFNKNGFSKTDCKIYQTNIKFPHFSIIRGILKEVGYELISENKVVYEKRKKVCSYTNYSTQLIE